MYRLRSMIAAASLLLALPVVAQTSTWTIDPAHSSVQFSIKHLGVSTVRGSFQKVAGTVSWDEKDPSKSSVEAVIDATSVNTGNDQRDTHLKSPDFFDVAKNPTITFKSTSVRSVNGKLEVIGNLTLTGVTKPTTLEVEGPAAPQTMKGKTISGFSAEGLVKRTDYNFGTKYAAPMLGDEVKFTIDLEVDKH